MFSGKVKSVSNTRIFARGANVHQVLVYSMRYQARADLAMILPLPVSVGAGEDAVEFISLEAYPEFFDDMEAGFPSDSKDLSTEFLSAVTVPPATLEVHEVGDYEASFVPQLQDFARLDERFCLPSATWDKLPSYADFGFAVFKLKNTDHKAGTEVHPMAFRFHRRDSNLLYFPTLHVHDQRVPAKAKFDHTLYCQTFGIDDPAFELWQRSQVSARVFMDTDRAPGILDPTSRVRRLEIRGTQVNSDTLVSTSC